jgi:hypothetical protein
VVALTSRGSVTKATNPGTTTDIISKEIIRKILEHDITVPLLRNGGVGEKPEGTYMSFNSKGRPFRINVFPTERHKEELRSEKMALMTQRE